MKKHAFQNNRAVRKLRISPALLFYTTTLLNRFMDAFALRLSADHIFSSRARFFLTMSKVAAAIAASPLTVIAMINGVFLK